MIHLQSIVQIRSRFMSAVTLQTTAISAWKTWSGRLPSGNTARGAMQQSRIGSLGYHHDILVDGQRRRSYERVL
jgi:hypothetical protein